MQLNRQTPETVGRIAEYARGAQDAIGWHPQQWSELLSAHDFEWPDKPSTDAETSTVSRTQVKSLARVVRSLGEADQARGVAALFVWSQVWGYGPVAYGPHRVSSILARTPRRSPNLSAVDALTQGYAVLMAEGAIEAYRRMSWECWIPGLGPAFLTKFLYFAGYDALSGHSGPLRPRPLILDAVVSRVLRQELGVNFPSSWSTTKYGEYLEFMENTARGQFGISPEQLEEAFFRMGQDHKPRR